MNHRAPARGLTPYAFSAAAIASNVCPAALLHGPCSASSTTESTKIPRNCGLRRVFIEIAFSPTRPLVPDTRSLALLPPPPSAWRRFLAGWHERPTHARGRNHGPFPRQERPFYVGLRRNISAENVCGLVRGSVRLAPRSAGGGSHSSPVLYSGPRLISAGPVKSLTSSSRRRGHRNRTLSPKILQRRLSRRSRTCTPMRP